MGEAELRPANWPPRTWIDDAANLQFRRLVEKEGVGIPAAFVKSERFRENLLQANATCPERVGRFAAELYADGFISGGAELTESVIRSHIGLPRNRSCDSCSRSSDCPTRRGLDKARSDLKQMDDQLRRMDERLDWNIAFARDGLAGVEELTRKRLGLPRRRA